MSGRDEMTATKGTAEHTAEGYHLRFERRLTQPIDTVWAALTRPDRLTNWIAGDEAVMELRVGGRVHMSGHGGIESTVLAIDPPHFIEYGWKTKDWDGGPIRFELAEDGDGTRLTFTHRFPEPDMQEQMELMKKMGFGPDMYDPIPRNLAGWHSIIDAFVRTVEGDDTSRQGTSQDNAAEPDWKKLHRMYKED